MSIATLLVLVLVLYLVSTLVDDLRIRRVFQVLIVVCLCLWLLDFAGLVDFDSFRVRRHR